MFTLTALVSILVAAHVAVSSPVRSRTPYVVKETHFVPPRWKQVNKAVEGSMINLNIGLKQSQFEELERHLYEVSDPNHKRYGKHLSIEHVEELVKPAAESLDMVQGWLSENGITGLSYSSAKDWISIFIPVETAERLLDTKYHIYEHEEGDHLMRTSKWSLPLHLHEHVDAIQPTEVPAKSIAYLVDWPFSRGSNSL